MLEDVDHNPSELRLFLKLLRSRLRFDEDCDLVSAYEDDGGGGSGSWGLKNNIVSMRC
jgi:hypothetical protein